MSFEEMKSYGNNERPKFKRSSRYEEVDAKQSKERDQSTMPLLRNFFFDSLNKQKGHQERDSMAW